ncbi:MAG: serine protease [Patescibacteria group bacterium]
MDIIVNIIVSILTAYLALTNSLATGVQYMIDSFVETEESAEMPAETLESIPSFASSIPDILLRSNEYQQAALVGATAGLSESGTNDPLSSIVNIFCTFTTEHSIRTTTGTGFFIDSDGIIMTNAHIAQFLLLEKTDAFGDAKCTVRIGSPAVARYEAELLYISPTWVQENAALIDDAAPMGTGERDYALLYISGDVEAWPLPARFPALPFDSDLLPTSVREAKVIAAGYPAKDLIEQGSAAALRGRTAATTISELYTFGSNYADVFSVRGSDVGAQGSSGGPIVNESGAVIGMIATRGDDEVDGVGSLRAITLSHINRSMKEESGFTLEENLGGDLAFRAKVFADTMSPFLLSILEGEQ